MGARPCRTRMVLIALAASARGDEGRGPAVASPLPHREEIAPGVYAAGFAAR